MRDRIARIQIALSAASTTPVPVAKAVYLAEARMLVSSLRKDLDAAETSLKAMESELDRKAYDKDPQATLIK